MKDITKKQSLLLLAVLLLIALAVRVYKINDHGIWTDEKTSVRSAVGIKDYYHIFTKTIYDHIPDSDLRVNNAILYKHPFTSADYWQQNTLHNVVRAVTLDNSNGLVYHSVLHYWLTTFGTGDLTGRLLSLLFGMLTLVLGYYFGRQITGSRMYALALVALLAFDCWLIHNNQLVRPYAFATFFCFLATVMFFNIVFYNKGGWRYPVYAVAAICSLGSHHLAIYIFITHAFIALLFLREKATWIKLCITGIPVIVLYVLWIKVYGASGMEILKWKNDYYTQMALLYPNEKFPGAGTPKNILGGVVSYLNIAMGTHFYGLGLRVFPTAAMLCVPFGLAVLTWFKSADGVNKKVIISLLLLIFALPILSALLAFQSKSAVPFGIYYAAYGIPLGASLLALCFSRINFLSPILKKIAIAMAALQCAFILISFPTVYREVMADAPTTNPYITIANAEKAQYKPGDVVIYDNWGDAQLTNVYLRDRNDIKQDVDSSLIDKVILLRNGHNVQLFDFEGQKFRY